MRTAQHRLFAFGNKREPGTSWGVKASGLPGLSTLAARLAHQERTVRADSAAPPPLFSAVETRHNFAIEPLERYGRFGARRCLFFCVRCKWRFRVEGHMVQAVDENGMALDESIARQRLASFATGPCPHFSRLTNGVSGESAEALKSRATTGLHGLSLSRRA